MLYNNCTFFYNSKFRLWTGDFLHFCIKGKNGCFEYYEADSGLGEKEPPLQGQLIMEGMEYLYE